MENSKPALQIWENVLSCLPISSSLRKKLVPKSSKEMSILACHIDYYLGFTQGVKRASMAKKPKPGVAWDYLPIHIWETIFSRLPISNILRMKYVCKSWKSLILSKSFLSAYKSASCPQDLYFLIFEDFTGCDLVSAYNPLEDKWVLIPHYNILSYSHRKSTILISDGPLVLTEDHEESILVSNMFTRTHRTLPPIPFVRIYPVALIVLVCSYKVVAVSCISDGMRTHVYDSITERWEVKAQFDGGLQIVSNAAYLDGLLFCINYSPNKLLAFDVEKGIWSSVNVRIDGFVRPRLLVHCGLLILVGGILEDRIMKRIGIWGFDKSESQWRGISFMPDHIFARFRFDYPTYFNSVDRRGMICIFPRTFPDSLVMYDLSENRWWCVSPCPVQFMNLAWIGLALEPRIDVLV